MQSNWYFCQPYNKLMPAESHLNATLNTSIRPSSSSCSLVETIKKVGDPISLLIVYQLSKGSKRFCHFEQAMEGVSSATLSDRLKKLAGMGWIKRKVEDANPPAVLYEIDEEGIKILPIVESIVKYAQGD